MNDDYRKRKIRIGFSGHRFKKGKVKILRPQLERTFKSIEKEVSMTSLLHLSLEPREVVQLVFESTSSNRARRVLKQFAMKGKPRRNLTSLPLRFVVDLEDVQKGDRLVLRLNVDRPVSGIRLTKEGGWSQEIHHQRKGLQDHPLTLKPTRSRMGISLKAPTDRALFEGASLFLVRDKD
jgi:hypothetical protein